MKDANRATGVFRMFLAAAMLAAAMFVAAGSNPAEAGVYFNDTQYTYKEYWASHSSFTSGCGADETPGGSWYSEPAGCVKSIDLAINDNISGAIAAVVYVDLWRNRQTNSARFTINNGPQFRPAVGDNFSRTPFSATVPLTQLQTGTNVFRFQESNGAYHVHDVMIRVYYDTARPIVAGSGSDVTPPTGQLTSVGVPGGPALSPTAGGTLAVDANQITLTATATDAKYVEFHAYYDGFDEDNDGVTRDWHNFLRNNYGPGGVEAKPNGATIGHIGTDSTAPYSVTWNLPDVVSQSGVKFKIRVVDQNGNVVEAPGGASADFTLTRSLQRRELHHSELPGSGAVLQRHVPIGRQRSDPAANGSQRRNASVVARQLLEQSRHLDQQPATRASVHGQRRYVGHVDNRTAHVGVEGRQQLAHVDVSSARFRCHGRGSRPDDRDPSNTTDRWASDHQQSCRCVHVAGLVGDVQRHRQRSGRPRVSVAA